MSDTQHKSINRTKIDRRIDKHFMQSYWSALQFPPTNLPVLYRGMPQASHGIILEGYRYLEGECSLATPLCVLFQNILARIASKIYATEIRDYSKSNSNGKYRTAKGPELELIEEKISSCCPSFESLPL